MNSSLHIARTVEELVGPAIASMGLELVHVIYRRESDGWILRILIDRPGGVTVDICKHLSRELSDLLDVEDPVPTAFRLEVSSPGLDRPLIKPGDFDRFAGRRIRLQTSRPVRERCNFEGALIGIQGGTVLLESEGTRYEIDHALIAKANLVPEIEGFPSRPGD